MAAISAAIICLVAFSGSLGALASIPATMTTVGGISLVSTNLPLTATPTPDQNTRVTVSATVNDLSGSAGIITEADAGMRLFDAAGTQIQQQDCFGANGTVTAIDANNVTLTGAFSLSNTLAPGPYMVKMWVQDNGGNDFTLQPIGTITYNSLIGLSVDSGQSIAFGTVQYGVSTAPVNVLWHNSGNTVFNIKASAPDWQSTTSSKTIPANTLTASTIPLSNSGVQVFTASVPGGAVQQMPFVENMIPYSSSLGGQTFQTAVTLTAA